MTRNIAMSRGWTAAVAVAILATVAALAFLGIARAASVTNLTVGSATVAPGESVTVEVTATVVEVGAYRFDLSFDASELQVTSCTSLEGFCTMGVEAQIRMNGSKLSGGGINGDVAFGSITFKALGTAGTTVDVTVDASAQVLSDLEGTTLSATATKGVITIAAPVVTASPTATAVTLPVSGGAPGTSSANTMAWLLAATGLAVVAGGAWVLARAGREN